MAGFANFIEDRDIYQHERPFACLGFEGADWPQTNMASKELPLPNLTDLRSVPRSEWPSLDTHLFCFAEQPSGLAAAGVGDDNIQSLVEEVGSWLKEFLDAETVIPGAIVVSRPSSARSSNYLAVFCLTDAGFCVTDPKCKQSASKGAALDFAPHW